jgi:hypothetical protein
LDRLSEDGWHKVLASSADIEARATSAKAAILVRIDNHRETVLKQLSVGLLKSPPQGDPVWLLFKDRLFPTHLRALADLAKQLDALRAEPTGETTQQFFDACNSWLGLKIKKYVNVHGLPVAAVQARLDIPALAAPLQVLIYSVSAEDQLEYVRMSARRVAGRHAIVLYLPDDPAPLERFHVSGQKIIRVPIGLLFVVAASKRRRERFAEEVLKQADLVLLSPYKTRGFVSHNMFYGRETELALLVAKVDTSFAIYGPRRIGKTSLAHELKFALETRREPREVPAYCDCSVLDCFDDVCHVVACLLEASWQRGQSRAEFLDAVYDVRKRRVPDGKFVLILDEVDRLIRKDHRAHADFFWMIRSLTNRGVARVVLCGYRALRRASRDLNHPAYNMFDDIHLHNLAEDDAKRLIGSPLEALGVSFSPAKASIVAQILSRTSTHPGTIQFFCGQLLRLLNERQERTITSDDIDAVDRSNEFVDYVLDGVKRLPEPHRKLISAHTAVVDDLLRWMILREDPKARSYLCYAQPAIPRVVKRIGGLDKVR